jgi:putative transposase
LESAIFVLVSEFVEHYHIERTHQGIANVLIDQRAETVNDNDNGSVTRRKRLGGMLSFYRRGAA